ncbi:MAG: radical SAM family heme chaperone HemW [Thermogemmata sp.]|nr:radical SAM family heme chaperone HemW [Thermogemmata fonticola]
MSGMREAAWEEPRAAYVHIPFCAHHCGYCDFAVIAGADHLMRDYLQALACELRQLEYPRPVQTLFLGGGTPTYLPLPLLEELLSLLKHWLPLAFDPEAPGATADASPAAIEFSVEATPESLDPDKLALLRAYGVTRLSVGVQSFRSESLQALERRHTSTQAEEVVAWARDAGFVVSLDLIFAIPGTTLADWAADVECALALRPEHLSTYSLTYEKGTPLWKRWQRGQVQAVPEEVECEMYAFAIDRLTSAGFEHYEISNFARPGYRCRHNETYWANEAYYGFGAGAVRYVRGCREGNVRDTRQYIQRLMRGQSVTVYREKLSPWERACETLAVQLRRRRGIDRRAFHEQTGVAVDELAGGAIRQLQEEGLLEEEGAALRLTRRGLFVADAVIAQLWAAASPCGSIEPSRRYNLPVVENVPQ